MQKFVRLVAGVVSFAVLVMGLEGREPAAAAAVPVADPTPAGDGDVTMTYYDNDLARSISQGGTTTTFDLDALDRRATETSTTGGVSGGTVRHYTDSSDNPTWVTQGATTQRYAELIGSDLALTIDQTGKAVLPLANLHGDVVTSVDLTTGQLAAAISSWCNPLSTMEQTPPDETPSL